MTRDELCSLPPAMAIKIIVELLGTEFAQKLAGMETRKAPRPPRFDARISRKGGFQWASETDLEGLRWWLNRFEASANEGGQWASKDARRAEKLSYWVAWREVYPDVAWTGQRNDEVCTAPLPTGKPQVHEWEQRRDRPLTPRSDADDSEEQGDNMPW